nr:hypothetical protein [Deltaproteobacteria bacterium]
MAVIKLRRRMSNQSTNLQRLRKAKRAFQLLKRCEVSDRIISLCLGAVPLFIYGPNLPIWWIGDDTQILKHVASQSFWEYFLVPSVWQELSPYNLTPWVDALYDLDLFLFGLRPAIFCLHHLLICALLIVTTYYFLRLWLNRHWAFAASFIFVFSPCYANNVYFLMTRHYVEGLLWSLLAIIFYIKALRDQRPVLAYWGALFYLIATLCKEIYVPLVLLLPVWPEEDFGGNRSGCIQVFSKRLFYFLPFVLMAGAYTFYRRWMLGNWIGGYGDLAPSRTDFSALLNDISHFLLANNTWLIVVIVPFAIWGICGGRSDRWKLKCFVLLVVLLSVAPLLDLGGFLCRRHLFLPTFLLLIAVSIGMSRLWRQRLTGRLVSLLGVLVLFFGLFQANQYTQNELRGIADQYSAQGLFLWDVSSNQDALFVESIPGWYFEGLSWLRTHIEQREEMARPIIDICYILYTNATTPHWQRFWRYDYGKKQVVRMDPEIVREKCQKCMDVYRSDISLNVRIWQSDGLIYWDLGPYETGRYLLADPETGFTARLNYSGHISGTTDAIEKIKKNYICYVAQEGWTTCSAISHLVAKPE